MYRPCKSVEASKLWNENLERQLYDVFKRLPSKESPWSSEDSGILFSEDTLILKPVGRGFHEG